MQAPYLILRRRMGEKEGDGEERRRKFSSNTISSHEARQGLNVALLCNFGE